MLLIIIGLPLLGYIDRGTGIFKDMMPIIASLSLVVIAVVWHYKTTYLRLTENTLTNRGYHSFRDDTLEIDKIRYITRIPQTALPFVGPSLMLIYVRRPDGVIAHSTVREYSYDEAILRRFLTRIKEINPAIELDPEYEEFLRGERILRTKTGNTTGSVEKWLRDKGERW